MASKRPFRRHVLYELMAKRPEPVRTTRRSGLHLWPRAADKSQPALRAATVHNGGAAARDGGASARDSAASAQATAAAHAAEGFAGDAPDQAGGQAGGAAGAASGLRIRDGQVLIRANLLTGGIVLAAVMCLLVLVSFSLGRRTAGGPNDTSAVRIAAINGGPQAGADAGSFAGDGASDARGAEAASEPQSPESAALDRLTQPPGALSGAGAESGNDRSQAARGAAGDKLKYLWIQSIKTRSTGEFASAEGEARQIQEFLSRENVPTTLTAVSNGIILKSAEGLSGGRDGAADRAAFQQRILQLGQLYRKQGGQYDFNGCFWN